MLGFFAARQRVAPLSRLTWLFAAFILACGFTHFMEFVTFRDPVYRLSGAVKALTAIVSWATVVALIPAVPRLLGLMAEVGAVSPLAPRLAEDAESRARRYIVAILAAVMALLLRAALSPLLGDRQPYILPLLAVVVTAWYGGFGPAVACLMIAMVGTAMLFLPPYNSVVIEGVPNQLGFGMTLFVGLACAVLGQAQRSTRQALEAQLRATAEKQRELEAEVVRRTAAEAASRDARQFLESTINALSKHIAVLDENGTILEVNEAWQRFARENSGDELRCGVGANYLAACDAAAGDPAGAEIAAAIRGVLSGELDRYTHEYACHSPAAERWFVVTVTRFTVGGFARAVVSHEDITLRKQAESAVRDREERFRVLAEMISQLVWRANPAGEVEYFNLQWYRYTGQSAVEAVGGGWLDAVHPDDREATASAWTEATATGENYAHEYRLRGADGTYRWFLARGEPLRDQSGRILYWVGSCTDIDDQRRYAEHLERAVLERTAALETLNTELRRSNEDLDKFAYVASHDLQEPLRKIQAFGGRLESRFRDRLEGQGVEYLDRILASAGRMRRLIDDLLTFARVTTKARPFVRTDLAAVAADVTADLEVRLAQDGGRVDVGSLPTIDADPSQMRQLFQNLVSNALKFQRPGVPPVVRVAAAVEPTDAGEECVITVADNGIGFEADYRDRIFELFQRLHGRDQYEGTGLGLAICRKIAERHRGTISADGRPGEGATFTIRLPVHQPRGEV